MAEKSSVCGNKIGIFTMTMNFKDGTFCSKCYKYFFMVFFFFKISTKYFTS